jgi:hypothetical protein
MNEAQKDALSRISEILREHFEIGIVAVEVDTSDDDSAVFIRRHGGYAAALGLLSIAQRQVLDDCEDTPEDDEEER